MTMSKSVTLVSTHVWVNKQLESWSTLLHHSVTRTFSTCLYKTLIGYYNVLLILKAESLLFLDLILNENLSVLVQLHFQSNAEILTVIIIPQSMGGNYIATPLWFYFLFKNHWRVTSHTQV